MTKRNVSLIVLALIGLGSIAVEVAGQTSPRTIEFAKLGDYVNDYDKRRDGERLIVDDVPLSGDLTLKYDRPNKIYFFSPDESGGVGNSFYTSPTLATNLRQHLKLGDYGSVRIFCTLVQFVSEQDVYRSSFVTKIEGFDGHGRLAWTITGPPPVKLKLQG